MEAEFAEMAGRLVTTLVGLRLKRGLFYQCSWPHAMTAVLNETIPDMFDETMKRFERDLQNFEELEALEAHTDEQEKLTKRSQFKMRAVKQYKHAVNEMVNGKYTEETKKKIKKVARDKIAGILQTELLEDINNVQKNRDRESHSSGMNRKPVAAWAQTLCSDLVDGKHRWTAAQPDVPVKSKTTKIPKECFEPTPSKRSINWSDIASTDQTTSWHSPQATNNTVNCGDHELINDCKLRYGTFNEVGEAWLGELLRSTHNLVIKVRVNSQSAWRVFGTLSYLLRIAQFWHGPFTSILYILPMKVWFTLRLM